MAFSARREGALAWASGFGVTLNPYNTREEIVLHLDWARAWSDCEEAFRVTRFLRAHALLDVGAKYDRRAPTR